MFERTAKKTIMYLSAFLPMFTTMWIKEVMLLLFQNDEKKTKLDLKEAMIFLSIEFCILAFIAFAFYFWVKRNKKITLHTKIVKSIKNRTAEYYLSYYSLFVLALIEFSLLDPVDLIVLTLLLIILGVVYIKNGLFYINPTVNLFRSIIYEIEYQDINTPELVISHIPLTVGDKITVPISEYNFTFLKEKCVLQDEEDDENDTDS